MELALLGLGRMGGNMATRLQRGGHRVVVWNRTKSKIDEHVALGMEGAYELADIPKMLTTKPRIVWFMLPAGQTTDATIDQVAPMLDKGDIIVDGANSRWTDDKRRAPKLAEMGLHYVDAGVSGGIWGLTEGYSLMVGGEKDVVNYCEPIFKTLAPPQGGYGHMGPTGAGHFTKMVHNGIEYGMMQAYGEGFEILKKSEYDFDLLQVGRVWQYGSVVRSWLLDLAVDAFEKHGNDLEFIKGYVEDSGEGRWTVEAAMAEDVPAPIITTSLIMRFVSRQEESFSAKVLAALRNEFGGHEVKSA
ncbi:MAG TPA: decarboxylating 6-phosphogluconate dehydrogenase [Anaerolineae bacterium]|nr:decarboxylating 6-phosphogluconate dehydrogenase [Anaerolineae bacterium]